MSVWMRYCCKQTQHHHEQAANRRGLSSLGDVEAQVGRICGLDLSLFPARDCREVHSQRAGVFSSVDVEPTPALGLHRPLHKVPDIEGNLQPVITSSASFIAETSIRSHCKLSIFTI